MGRVIFFLLALVIIAAAVFLSTPDNTYHWNRTPMDFPTSQSATS